MMGPDRYASLAINRYVVVTFLRKPGLLQQTLRGAERRSKPFPQPETLMTSGKRRIDLCLYLFIIKEANNESLNWATKNSGQC